MKFGKQVQSVWRDSKCANPIRSGDANGHRGRLSAVCDPERGRESLSGKNETTAEAVLVGTYIIRTQLEGF